MHPFLKHELQLFIILLQGHLFDQMLLDLFAAREVEFLKVGFFSYVENGQCFLSCEVGVVQGACAYVLGNDSAEDESDFLGEFFGEVGVFDHIIVEEDDELDNFGGEEAVPKHEVVGEKIHEDDEADGVLLQTQEEVDHEPELFLALLFLLFEQGGDKLVVVDHDLHFAEVLQAYLGLVEDLGQKEDALVGSYPDQLLVLLVDPEGDQDGEEGEVGGPGVAEQLYHGLVLEGGQFEDDGLQQLHIVLDGLLVLPLDCEFVEEELVQGSLGEDVDQMA